MRRIVMAAVAIALLVALVALRLSMRETPPKPPAPEHANGSGSTSVAGTTETTPELPPGSPGDAAAPVDRSRAASPTAYPWPAPPTSYVVSHIGAGVQINLAGGASTVSSPYPDAPRTGGRTIRGHVIGANGPVANVPVLAGRSFTVAFAHLGSDAGTTTGADGSFEIAHIPADWSVHVMAVTPAAWSEIVDLAPAPTDATAELHLGAMTGVEGTVHYAGKIEAIEILIARPNSRDLTFNAQTEQGRYRIAPLAPGVYTITVGLAQEIGGGASQRESKTITLEPGTIVRADFELATGVTIAVALQLPGGSAAPAPRIVEYWLLDGAEPAPKSHADIAHSLSQLLYGGADAQRPMQFHDRAPGSYLVCAEARTDRTDKKPLFGCAPITVAATPPVQEVALPVVAAP